MNDEQKQTDTHICEEPASGSLQTEAAPADTTTRREAIKRYSKYALVAAPLLMFASRARAIHSKPS